MKKQLAVILALGVLHGLGWPTLVGAQTFPARPIQVIVPVPAGGGTDLLARTLGQKVSDALRQPVIIDNKPGAGGNIGAEFVAKATPDGYTLLLTPGTIATNIAAYRKLPYDLLKDFQPVSLIGQTPSVLVINAAMKVGNLKDFVELARAKPGELNFGTAGNGSPQHLHSEFFNQLASTRTNHIPYKGQSQAMNDLLGGQIQYMFSPLQNSLQYIQQGRLRALAVASPKRSPFLPDVPTFEELGYRHVDLVHWFAMFAPAGTPRPVIQKLYATLTKVGNQPEMKAKLTKLGFEMAFTAPEPSTDFLRAELVRWARVAAYAGIQAE